MAASTHINSYCEHQRVRNIIENNIADYRFQSEVCAKKITQSESKMQGFMKVQKEKDETKSKCVSLKETLTSIINQKREKDILIAAAQNRLTDIQRKLTDAQNELADTQLQIAASTGKFSPNLESLRASQFCDEQQLRGSVILILNFSLCR